MAVAESKESRNHAQKSKLASRDPLLPTIFHEAWWLNAATDKQYEQVEVSSGTTVIARLPYWIQKKALVFRNNGLPPLTHVLGPGINEGSGSEPNRFLRRYELTRELLSKLPPVSSFRQKLHRGISDALGFQSAGFRAAVQFSFEVAPAPEQELWQHMRNKTRNVIRRAEERLCLSTMDDGGNFLAFYEGNLRARGVDTFIESKAALRLCSEALYRNRGRIFCARDEKGSLVAAIFVVWDDQTTYYLMSTRTGEAGNGGVSLLIWNAMKFSAANNLTFDFDGVAQEGSILLYSGFGGKPKTRFMVSRDSLSYRLAVRLWCGSRGQLPSAFDKY